MTRPEFSVIIPTFNRRRTIQRAIESVLAQSYPADEIILVDDASTDDTAEWVERRFPGLRVKRLEENQGPAVARNAAIDLARNDHLAFLDSDDAWHEDYLASIAEAWQDNPDAAIVYTQYDKIEDWPGGRVYPMDLRIDGDQIEAMLRNNFIHTSSLMSTRRDWTVAVGGFDPAYRIGEDRAMYLRLLLRGPAVPVPKRLVRRHVGNDNLTHELERWWRDATTIVARFVAMPEFAAYHGIEDQSRARVWEAIHWHDRQQVRGQKERNDQSTHKPTGDRNDRLVKKGAVRQAKPPTPKNPAFLFLHAGGMPVDALSAMLTQCEVFGYPKPWFDHDGPMQDEVEAFGVLDFKSYFDALLADAATNGDVWSALVDYRDLDWISQKLDFDLLRHRLALKIIRLSYRNPLLQAVRLRGETTPAFDDLANGLSILEQAEIFGDDWLRQKRLRASRLWIEDLVDSDLLALRVLLQGLSFEPPPSTIAPLAPPLEDELSALRAFREEAAYRHWSHVLTPTRPA